MPSALNTNELKKLGIDKRKLRYWIDLSLLEPHKKASGKGTAAEFNIENLIHIYIIRELTESGINTKLISTIMTEVRKCDYIDLPDLSLITNGKDFIQISREIRFSELSSVNPLYIMRISPLYTKALRDFQLFTRQTYNKEDYHGSSRN